MSIGGEYRDALKVADHRSLLVGVSYLYKHEHGLDVLWW